ncbi:MULTISPECIES: MFS transporter [unclassified Bradyrhizobium]|uniref:MFS transporter n=1 Tax=unclassified Bradyrhizobium TaxID=2631580 RepID=UPI0028EF0B84|nr:MULTISPECIES: MFS transporter [unclassified Bradyrhizobium]
MRQELDGRSWQSLLTWKRIPILSILLGGVLVQSMNVLMLATMLPSIVGELGGVAMISWPTTAYLASSIVAATSAGALANAIGTRTVYCAGVLTFGLGALLCSTATAMVWIVVGRLIQGFGGGLETAVAYVLVRGAFPQGLWSRTVALMSTSWSVSVMVGPLVGGMFTKFGSWRAAFVATLVAAAALAIGAFIILPATINRSHASRVPTARVVLICVSIAATSFASVVSSLISKLGLLVLAMISLAAMLRLNRHAPTPMLPRNAFSWRAQTGVGLWLGLLLCIAFSPLQIYMPMFLQQIHGFDPLAAGFSVATASLAWTVASMISAGASGPWPDRLIVIGPLMMALSLVLMSWLAPGSTVLLLIATIPLLGAGIGQCWPIVAQRIMEGAEAGDETVAASSVPTIQQMGFALGGAIAGIVANASGLTSAISNDGMVEAAFWVPTSFVVSAVLAAATAIHLRKLRAA